MPKNTDVKLKCFKVTISTKYDVSDETVAKFSKWCQKNTTMHHMVIEKGDTNVKHIHALLCIEKGYVKRHLQDYVWKHFVRDFNEGCIARYAVRVDVNYDDKWYNDYLRKESDVEIVSTNYDASHEGKFYPSAEEQEYFQACASVNSACDPWYADHELKFKEWWLERRDGNRFKPPPHGADVHEYLLDCMYVQRTMKPIADERRRRQLAASLARYVTKDAKNNYEDRKYFASLEGPVVDFHG